MLSLNKIADYANQQRENMGIDADAPIGDMVNMIRDAGYEYLEESFGNEFSGFSKSIGSGNFLIGFNTEHYWSERFKRFTLSHEIGHISMIEHRTILYGNGRHYSVPEFRSTDSVEKEADAFAINFLAPRGGFLKKIAGKNFTNSIVTTSADDFTISNYAAALRFVEVTDVSCALIVCNKNGFIDYEKRSSLLKNSFSHGLISRNKVATSTLTYDLITTGTTEDTAQTNLQDWYPDLPVEIGAVESVIELGYNDKFLVLITPDVANIDEYVKEQRY